MNISMPVLHGSKVFFSYFHVRYSCCLDKKYYYLNMFYWYRKAWNKITTEALKCLIWFLTNHLHTFKAENLDSQFLKQIFWRVAQQAKFITQKLWHNDFRSAGCLPFYKTSVAPTANQALNEIFILYKDRLQLQLKEIEDDLCMV